MSGKKITALMKIKNKKEKNEKRKKRTTWKKKIIE